MYQLGGAYVVGDDELRFDADGKVTGLVTEWHWVGMGILRARWAEAYVVVDAEGNLERV